VPVAEIHVDEQECLHISGNMVFVTVPSLLHQSTLLMVGRKQWIIDLAGVRHSDSAGLALLLEWLGQAREDRFEIKFRNIPDSLLRIARLSNVDRLLFRP